ncbi:MAG: AAA family ATPase [archaeon]
MAKIIGIISLKGGVGKTSVTSALGDSIASFGKKVLLVDGNLSAPNLGLHFNIVDPDVTLHHILDRNVIPSAAIHNLDNFDVIPASLFTKLRNSSPLKLKDRIGPIRRKYDFIIIDSSPSLDEETLGAMLASNEILVVTTPDHPTLSNTLRAVKLARQRGTPISGIILNKVYDKEFELSLDNIEETTGVPVMAVIPHDINIPKAISKFTPSTSYKPKSRASEEYKKLAAALIGIDYQPQKLKKLWGWISPEKQDINRTIFYKEMFK